MLNLIVNGAAGRMGQQLISQITAHSDKYQLAFAADAKHREENFGALSDFAGSADCLIDFSNHNATTELSNFAIQHKIPLVVATTGQSPAEIELLKETARKVPVFHAANMSLGIATLIRLVTKATALFPDADIEIVEQHHNRKLDVPSGTALAIASAIQLVRPNAKLIVGRHEDGERDINEIGIHSLRLGNVVGIHEIILSNGAETLTLKHEAHSREVFALGALQAAKFLAEKENGYYQMTDLLKGISA